MTTAERTHRMIDDAHGISDTRHCISSADFNVDDLRQLFQLAEQCARFAGDERFSSLLNNKTVATLFYENSTRTRVSFELAAKRLGADTVHLSADGSSIKKGETLNDTLDTLIALGCDAVVMRHPISGIAKKAASFLGSRAALLNAGDGCGDHPSQGLLDAFTLHQYFKGELAGKKITIVGDALHSRVIRSNLVLLNTFGMEVHVCGPVAFVPKHFAPLGCLIYHKLEDALNGADAVMALRLQQERQQSGLIASLGEYHREYGLTLDRLKQWAKPNAPIMHPGPMNRGVEISSTLADCPQRSLIRRQVSNGLLVRQALLIRALIPQTIPEILSW